MLQANVPAATVAAFGEQLSKLIADFKPSPPTPGTTAVDFTLPNQKGGSITLSKLLASHKAVILIWYRGSWCPYCNLTLKVWRDNMPALKAAGIAFVALTPESADESLSMREKDGLEFDVCTDDGCGVAEKYGLAYEVPQPTKETMAELGVNMDTMNMNDGRAARLPVTGTVVVGKDGKVVFSEAGVDYRQRVEPSKVLEFVNGL